MDSTMEPFPNLTPNIPPWIDVLEIDVNLEDEAQWISPRV